MTQKIEFLEQPGGVGGAGVHTLCLFSSFSVIMGIIILTSIYWLGALVHVYKANFLEENPLRKTQESHHR